MASEQPGLSELEVLPLYRVARVPIYVTRLRSRLFLLALVAIDIVFIVAHLVATLPEVRALAPGGVPANLDIGLVANLPWAWSLLKLVVGAALTALMVRAHPVDRRPGLFWRLAAVVLAALTLAEAAQLHILWAAGGAPLIFGVEAPQLYGLLSRLLPLELIVLAGIAVSARRSPGAIGAFVLAGLLFVVSEGPIPASIIEAVGGVFTVDTLATAWRGGIDALGISFLVAAIAFAICDCQAVSVRYVYHGG